MITLRELKEKDATLMLEWMHDPDIQRGFKKNMLGASLEDAVRFCKDSAFPSEMKSGDCFHYAIVNDEDEYLGTISLKDIDTENKTAEYAITLRKKAQGHGFAKIATGLVLRKAFYEYGLHRVYLNVLANNIQAIKLYERCGFTFEGEFRDHLYLNGKYVNWKWYGILATEYDESLYGF